MDKIREYDNNISSGISVVERKSIIVSGVKKIIRFDDLEFLLDTCLGLLEIKGAKLELLKLDTFQGNVSIKGDSIDSIVYCESDDKSISNGFLGKLFK